MEVNNSEDAENLIEKVCNFIKEEVSSVESNLIQRASGLPTDSWVKRMARKILRSGNVEDVNIFTILRKQLDDSQEIRIAKIGNELRFVLEDYSQEKRVAHSYTFNNSKLEMKTILIPDELFAKTIEHLKKQIDEYKESEG